jgi:hypothetical protein
MFGDRDPLDALLLEAMDQAARRKVKKLPTIQPLREEKIRESFKALYATPENWLPTRCLAVIHRSERGEHTLLGAFQELKHVRHRHLFSGKTVQIATGAMKLERCLIPSEVEDQMFVTGDHWLHGAPPPPNFPDNPEGIVDRQLLFDLVLHDLQVEAIQAKITVRTEHGWTRRVVLSDTTQFHCPTNRQTIFLPKGLDILDGMSFDCKKALKEYLARG